MPICTAKRRLGRYDLHFEVTRSGKQFDTVYAVLSYTDSNARLKGSVYRSVVAGSVWNPAERIFVARNFKIHNERSSTFATVKRCLTAQDALHAVRDDFDVDHSLLANLILEDFDFAKSASQPGKKLRMHNVVTQATR